MACIMKQKKIPSSEIILTSFFLAGFGGGIVIGICFLIIPLYFDRRLGLANAFMMTGICVGQIFIAPFIRYLLDNYSYRGAALIFGATMMNSFVAISLFQPVKWHMKKQCQKTDPPQENLVPLIPQKGNIDGPQQPTNLLDAVPKYEGSKEEPNWAATADQARVKQRQLCTSLRMSECSQHLMILSDNSSGTTIPGTYCTLSDCREGSKGNGALGVIKTLWIILVRVAQRTKSDVGILRSHRALIISLAYTFTINSFFNFIMLVPFVMEEEGHTLQESAWCISVMGICNLMTRLIVSPLTDWRRFDMRLCLMFGCAIMGSSMVGKVTWLFCYTNIRTLMSNYPQCFE